MSGLCVWEDGIGGNARPAVANAENVTKNTGYPTMKKKVIMMAII